MSHANSILLLRLILAGLVMLSHSWWVLTGSDTGEPLMRLTRGVLNCGALAVNGFFVLSGLLVTASWFRSGSTREYLVKRILRIFPAFIVLCLVQALILVPAFTGGWSAAWSAGAVVRVLLFGITLGAAGAPMAGEIAPFPSSRHADLNASLWTIRPEFLCYLLLALAGTLRLLGRAAFRWAAFAAAVLAFAFQPDWEWHELLKGIFGTFWYWPRFLAFFLAGVCLYHGRKRLPATPWVSGLLTAGLLASTIHPVALRIAMPVLGAWLLSNLADSPWLTRLSSRLRGDVSYGVYLYGFPCQQILVSLTGTDWNPYLFTLVAFPITLVPASASWWLVEKPLLQLKTRLLAPGA